MFYHSINNLKTALEFSDLILTKYKPAASFRVIFNNWLLYYEPD